MSSVGSTKELQSPAQLKQRSRAGCWNCRSKTVKKKCDQARPSCGRCLRLTLRCDYSARPTLAERRCAQRTAFSTRSAESSPTSIARSESSTSSHVALSAPNVATCSLHLAASEHEAIRYFRTKFARAHHVKHTEYSLISLMFRVAQADPMVMHMVIAIGLEGINTHRPCVSVEERMSSLHHYSKALRLMAEAVSPGTSVEDFDVMCTALWMMIFYEQQLGDAQYTSYMQHLKGLSSLLWHHYKSFLALEYFETSSEIMPVVFVRQAQIQPSSKLSIYSARVLIWTALLDAAAAFAGIGGQVNTAILNTVLRCNPSTEGGAKDPVKAFIGLHRYSAPLYRLAWGEYPEHEMLADVEDRDIYGLLAGCVQLRFMTARLASEYTRSPVEAAKSAQDVEKAIEGVGQAFGELIEVASRLSLATDNQHRLVANVRAIVPMYHAVVLDFMRLAAAEQPLDGRQRHALKEILNLAFQSHQYGGEEAVMKLAWPLFMAALETDDMLHRDWIMKQFRNISKYGINFRRAHDFLVENIPLQLSSGKRICLRTQMERTTRFVLG